MDDIVAIIGYIALALGSGLALFSRMPKQTIENQKDLIETLEKRLQALEIQKDTDREQHLDNVKAIADLQGQIKVYKELPLQEMAKAMQDISRVNEIIANSNSEILETLKSSAVTLAVNTKKGQHVDTQVVDNQVINTKG